MEISAAGAPRTLLPPATPAKRKPLQPKNSFANSPAVVACLPKPKFKPTQIRQALTKGDADKENRQILRAPAADVEVEMPREASLAEELDAARRRTERVRLEKERTERALKERDAVLEKWMKELESRWEEQRNLELELRLLMKLKDLRSDDLVLSPALSLRKREEQKKRLRETSLEDSQCEVQSDEVAQSMEDEEAES